MDSHVRDAEAIALFCRININTKRGLPIRASEMGLLILVVQSGQPTTPLEAAKFFRISKPMVTSMVRSLCAQGYMLKTPSTVDGRSYTLIPADKARRLVEETYQEYVKRIELLRAAMGSEDYERFIQLIERANGILSSEEKTNG